MNLLHVFILSVGAFALFQMLAPVIAKAIVQVIGTVANMTVVNALIFGAIFVAIFRVNERLQVLKQLSSLL